VACVVGNEGRGTVGTHRVPSAAEAKVGRKIGTFRTDHGGEFTMHSFIEHCSKQGVQ
jgi:hypothetical protein